MSGRHRRSFRRHRSTREAASADPCTMLVTGATGFIGRHVCRHMIEAGYRIVALVRDVERATALYGPCVEAVTSLDTIDDERRIEVIVNLAGEPIMGGRWTPRRRRSLLESRLRVTNDVVALIARLHVKPRVLISASAAGYYGVRGDEPITEADRGRPMFQSHLCQVWELAAQAAEAHGVRVCRLRFGLVLGSDGGALPGLAWGAQLGLRLVLGSGNQWVSWIHIRDILGLIDFCISRADFCGPINATSPRPVRQVDFARSLMRSRRFVIGVRLPERLLRLALGELAQLLVDGQHVVPMKAQCAGFRFSYTAIDAAISDLLQPGRIDAEPAHIMYGN